MILCLCSSTSGIIHKLVVTGRLVCTHITSGVISVNRWGLSTRPAPSIRYLPLLFFPFLSPLSPSHPFHPLKTPEIQLGVWRSAVASPAVYGAEPQAEIEFGAFRTKNDIWWQQLCS